MAHGGTEKYYNPANKVVNDGDTAFANDVNDVNYAVDTALARVADDLDVMDVKVTTLSAEAEAWSHNDQGIPPDPLEPAEFSSKAYAIESKEYAVQTEGVVVHKADGTTQLIDSAYVSATKAAASQVDALASKNAAALSETNAENHSLQAWADQQVGFESRQAAQAAASAAEDSADLAALSAANLPNATTAGANKIPVTNSSGDGWDYVSRVGFGRKNLLINGGFDVWQRGTSFTTEGGYYAADRWFFVTSRVNNISLTRNEFSIAEFENYFGKKYYNRISYTLGSSAEDVSYSARIEDGVRLTAGKTVTLSFLCREAAGKPVYIQYRQYLGGTDYTGEIGTVQFSSSFERKSVTFEIPSVAGKIFGPGDSFLEISFIFTERFNTLVPRQAGTFDIGYVQLEFGDTATDFEYRHPAEELMLCQRYYETGTLRGPFAQYNSSYAVGPYCPFLVQKRVAPNVLTGVLAPIGHDGTPGTLSNANVFARGFNPLYNWTGGTVGRSFFGQLTWTADAEI